MAIVKYLPEIQSRKLPVLFDNTFENSQGISEREILYKVLFDMKNDINELKSALAKLNKNNELSLNNNSYIKNIDHLENLDDDLVEAENITSINQNDTELINVHKNKDNKSIIEISAEKIKRIKKEKYEPRTLQDIESEIIIKSFDKNNGNKKKIADELGISERTLYRKCKELGIEGNSNAKKNNTSKIFRSFK
jgi:DNA-binding NtrC family response regulator